MLKLHRMPIEEISKNYSNQFYSTTALMVQWLDYVQVDFPIRWGFDYEQVIEGLHMVSGTRCPAWSDELKKWSESRAAAPKSRCPVGHRGEFIHILRRHV